MMGSGGIQAGVMISKGSSNPNTVSQTRLNGL